MCQARDSHVMGLPGRERGPDLVEIPSLFHLVETTRLAGSVEKWTSLQKGGGAGTGVITEIRLGDVFTDTNSSLQYPNCGWDYIVRSYYLLHFKSCSEEKYSGKKFH